MGAFNFSSNPAAWASAPPPATASINTAASDLRIDRRRHWQELVTCMSISFLVIESTGTPFPSAQLSRG
jgi:hypothetical protein